MKKFLPQNYEMTFNNDPNMAKAIDYLECAGFDLLIVNILCLHFCIQD